MTSRNLENKMTDKVTTDAVHRRFLKEKPANNFGNDYVKSEPEISDFYFCQQCNSNISRTVDKSELKLHFQNKTHEPFNHCIYCKKPVYEYVYNKRIEIYHYCSYND